MKKNEILSAEELYFKTEQRLELQMATMDCFFTPYDVIRRTMIDFAKLHVKAALEAAVEKADAGCDFGNMKASDGNLYATYAGHIGKVIIIKDSILSAYPEELIK